MTRIIFSTILVMLFSSEVFAQPSYVNSCNPAKIGECESVAKRYLPSRQTDGGRNPSRLFPENKERSQQLFGMAFEGAQNGCSQGDPKHCYRLAWQLIRGSTQKADEQVLAAWTLLISTLEMKCASGLVDACSNRMMLSKRMVTGLREYQDNIATIFTNQKRYALFSTYKQEIAKARVDLIVPACENGHVKACIELGEIFDVSIVRSLKPGPAIIKLSNSLRLNSCLLGSQPSCESIRMYFVSFNLAKESNLNDSHKIQFQIFVDEMTKSCDLYNEEACYALETHVRGESARYELFVKSCNAGKAVSCRYLGWTSYTAYTEKQHQAALLIPAIDFWEKGCGLGDANSCHALEHIVKL